MATPPIEQAKERVRLVEDAIVHAKGRWSSRGVSISSYLGITPQAQVLGAIESISRTKDAWAARRYKLAATDQAGWDRWVKDGNDFLKNLADIAQDSESASIQAIVAETAIATAKDTAVLAEKTVEAAGAVGRWLVVGLIAAAVVVFFVYRMRKG